MPIKGMTDNVVPRFPRLGKLRKGGERVKKVNKKTGKEYSTFGPDLDHFRFTPEGGNQDIGAAFQSAFGDAPRVIQVYLPYKTPEDNFPTWCEIWDASGLVHRCDGETMTLWREGSKLVSGQKPCTGGHKDGDYRNDAVGRLSLIIPELIEAGYVGYVVMETHGKHDCANVTSVLMATYQSTQRQDLRGIAFNLRRSKENISVPGWGERSEQRSRVDKWLVRIEPVADWTRFALEAAKQSALQLQGPRMTNPPEDAITGDFEPVEDTDFDEPRDDAEGDDEDDDELAEPQKAATPPDDLSPHSIRAKVAMLVGARDGQPANERQVGLAQGMLAACFNTDDDGQRQEMRHRVLRYLFGVGSSSELQAHHHLALLDWLHPARDEGGKYRPSELGAKEARIIEHAALLDLGQTEFEFAVVDDGGDDPLVAAAIALGGVIIETEGV